MKNMLKKVVLGAALIAGTLGLGATQAKAAVRIVVGGPVAYVPPCPGPGYFWTAGYYNAGVWVPGFWRFRGPGVGVGFVAHRDFRGPYYYHPDRFHPDRRSGPAPYRR
ncbi:MAG: hypothetical protein WAL75_01335 [Terracidiphilus sp.]